MRYELFIGLRYLRAKRREAFISLITIISTLGVAIGVMTLDIALSVMTGFEEDLRDRILGFNPHVSFWSYLGPIAELGQLAAKARTVAGVDGRAVRLRPPDAHHTGTLRRRAGARHSPRTPPPIPISSATCS